MKKTIFIVLLPLAALAQEPNFPVYLHPEEECEEVVTYLRDTVESIEFDLSDYPLFVRDLSDDFDAVYNLLIETAQYYGDTGVPPQAEYLRGVFNADMAVVNNTLGEAHLFSTNLLSSINQINCTTCIEDTPDVPGNTNGVNRCCDFTGLYQRLDTLIQLQTSIENHVSQLSNILSTVQQIKTNLDYTNFLLEHGFGDVTNMLNYANWDSLQYSNFGPATGLNGLYILRTLSQGTRFSLAQLTLNAISGNSRDYGWLPSLWWQNFDQMKILASLNSFELNKYQNFNGPVTNSLLYVSGSLSAPSPLLYFDSAVEDRDYYTYLTNYYFAMLRGDEEIEESHKTNWFTRVETLLAALVFADGSKSNLTEHVEDSVTNSINNVTDRFESFFDEVSGAPTSQIELVGDVEKSMYQSLRQFSSAFSDATIPRSVRVIRVEKSVGSKSVADVVDVSVEVDGRLLDLVELLRSATTLCWVFVGLWFMFKFSVWTVKKIYLLSRYAIDFFNMILGGK